ncbi:MAG: hypothetical protein CXZ00_08110 [Acidobacteria bacterium]|nr:MAG: hypothetical protein CXZ00_08110 [Acidobacteriota bacterium]
MLHLLALALIMIFAGIAVVRLLAPDIYAKLIRRVTSGAVIPRTPLTLESKLATLVILAFIGWTLWDWQVPESPERSATPPRSLRGHSSIFVAVSLGFVGIGLLLLFRTRSMLEFLTREQIVNRQGFPRGSPVIARVIGVALIAAAVYIILKQT